MPVGNDLVDLRDPANRPERLHPRFDRRVFGAPELTRLTACPDETARHRLRWALWAARESAYKYVRQLIPDTVFRPRAVDVWLPGEAAPEAGRLEGRVMWGGAGVPGGSELILDLDVDEYRVHAVVRGAGSAPALQGVRRAASVPAPAAASAGVRALAARTAARLLALDPATVRVVASPASEHRVPRALRGDSVLPVEVSLSHDGRWLACAVVLRPG